MNKDKKFEIWLQTSLFYIAEIEKMCQKQTYIEQDANKLEELGNRLRIQLEELDRMEE